MLVVIAHCSVQSRHVATGKVTDGIHRLGAVLAEDGLCRESGSSVMRLGFLVLCTSPRHVRCKCSGVQICTRVRHGSARFCGVLQRKCEDIGACVVTVGWGVGTFGVSVTASWALQHRFSTTISCSSRSLDTSSPSAHGGSWWINLASPLKLAWSQTPHSLILRCAFARK